MGKELALRESAVLSKVGFSPKTKRCIEEQRVDRQVSAEGRPVWAWIFTSRHSPGDQLDQDAEGWQEPLRPLAVVTPHPTPASRPSLTTHASHVCSSLHIRGFM